jgi:exonuclease 3'-5' domain-containing protein 1
MKDIRTEILDTTEQIRDLVDWLLFRHAPPGPDSPTMYIDLEGVNLCRDGSISIFTLLIDTGIPTGRACLIDVHKLGAEAFTTAGAKGQTLKDILQNEQILKVFLNGLAKCVESNVLTSFGRSELASWKLAKEKGGQLFMAAQGGSYEVFNTRPIPEAVISYCVGDVQHLPELRDRFWTRQTSQWRDLVRE